MSSYAWEGNNLIYYKKTPPIFLFWDLKLVYCQSLVRLICNVQRTKLSHYSKRNALLKLKKWLFSIAQSGRCIQIVWFHAVCGCVLATGITSHHCHCRRAPGTSLLVRHFDCCCCGLSGWNAVTWFLRILFRSPHVVKSPNFTPSKPWKNRGSSSGNDVVWGEIKLCQDTMKNV